MKKILLTSACVLGVSGVVFAQGTVNWGSVLPTAMTGQTNSTVYSSFVASSGTPQNGAVGGTSTTASSFYYELLYTGYSGSQLATPTTLAALNTWSDAGLSAVNNTGTAGRLSVVGASTQAVVPWSNGTTQSVMMVGWSANLGTTWSAALNVLNNWNTQSSTIVGNAFFGASVTGYINPASGNPGAGVFGTAPTVSGLPINSLNTQLNLLYAAPVPEPGTMALAALGGASLLLFRRRK